MTDNDIIDVVYNYILGEEIYIKGITDHNNQYVKTDCWNELEILLEPIDIYKLAKIYGFEFKHSKV